VAEYRDVAVHYVRDPQAVLHVYDGSQEIDTVQLTELRTTERLHAVMQRYFERKSDPEIQRDQNRQTLQRQQKAYQKFHRAEYVRQQHLHAQHFRREIMRHEPISWVSKDWLCHNYNKINKGFAITKDDLLLYAHQYLMKHNSE